MIMEMIFSWSSTLKTNAAYPFLELWLLKTCRSVSSYTLIEHYTKSMKFMSSWLDSSAYYGEQSAANFQSFPYLGLCEIVHRLTHPFCQNIWLAFQTGLWGPNLGWRRQRYCVWKDSWNARAGSNVGVSAFYMEAQGNCDSFSLGRRCSWVPSDTNTRLADWWEIWLCILFLKIIYLFGCVGS